MKRAAKSVIPAVTPSASFFMSVYTRTGDKGKTSLYGGKRISKASLRVEAYGSVDELQGVLGIVQSLLKDKNTISELSKIQTDLFEIEWALSKPYGKIDLKKRTEELEGLIDQLTKKLPELNNFIMPSGGVAGSHLHLARTVARRTERRIVELSENDKVQEDILTYMNRLSDLLFMFARFVNYKEKKKEVKWNPR